MRTLLVVLILAVPVTAAAADFECTSHAPACIVSARFESRIIPYVVRRPPLDAELTEAEVVAGIAEAFEAWSSIQCTSLHFKFEGVIGADEATEVPNEIIVVTEGWPIARADAYATTKVEFDQVRGGIQRARIAINDEHHTFGDVAAMSTCVGIVDLTTMLVHEVGHFIGIAHPCEVNFSTCGDEPKCPKPLCSDLEDKYMSKEHPRMWPELPYCRTFEDTLTTEDILAVCSIYPVTGPSQACSTIRVSEDALVVNTAFGCSATNAVRHAPKNEVWSGVLFVAFVLTTRRRSARRRSCRRSRPR